MKLITIPAITLTISVFAWNPWKVSIPNESLFRETNRFDVTSSIEKQMGYVISKRLDELDSLPKSYRTKKHPWTHRSWKLQSGLIAGRYLSTKFNKLESFDSRLKYIQEYPMHKIAKKLIFSTSTERDTLSPAEKYDLLVGDMNSTLSMSMWRHGQAQLREGPIENWMGLCEGSAGAMAMTDEPVKNIVLLDSEFGKKITFYASDIKALASLLYSEFVVQVPILGGRCNRNQANNLTPGLALECESVNPALWHRMVLTLVGQKQDVLFMDHTVAREVWNTPVISYKFHYINPQTLKKTTSLNEALVSIDNFTSDTRMSLRNPQTRYIVGVQMEVQVAGGTTYSTSGSQPATLNQLNYQYDLEIDSNNRILGGEWYSLTRPDFLWTLPKNYRPQTIAEEIIGVKTWNGERISPNWLNGIRESSEQSQPMTAIVNELIRRSAN